MIQSKRNSLPKLCLFLIFSCLVCFIPAFAQSSNVQMIDVYIKYGNVVYLDLSGKNVALTDQKVQNLESFVIGYRSWALVGEYVYNPSFYYSVNSSSLKGKQHWVNYQTISKYPDLAKRYKAIRPLSVNAKIPGVIKTQNGVSHLVWFKISNNDLVYFESRSSKNYKVPTSPLKWKDAISLMTDSEIRFSANDYTDEEKLKEIWKNFKSFEVANIGFSLNVKWDEEAIDEIYNLYEKYEKENKKIDDELKNLKESDKKTDPSLAYNKNDEMALPVEIQPHSAEVFKESKTVGLRAKGKVVFSSEDYYGATALNEKNTLFAFSLKNGGYHLLNTKGKPITIDGSTTFARIVKGKRPGTYSLYALQTKNFYETKRSYPYAPTGRENTFATEEEFAAMRQKDNIPPRTSSGNDSISSRGGRVLEYSLDTTFRYSRYILYTIDDKLNTISTETVYSAYFVN